MSYINLEELDNIRVIWHTKWIWWWGGEGLIVLLLGEGVKHKSYLDPCLKYAFAHLMTKSS